MFFVLRGAKMHTSRRKQQGKKQGFIVKNDIWIIADGKRFS